ncbi:MAG: rhodanese-like domain-containing protein [Thermaerobacter sp.]|nr:rhodanese-like domain-containing protein [Thermaerobacter sp.]
MPGGASTAASELAPEEAGRLLGSQVVQWLDVRPPAAGPRATIPGAIFVPLEEIAAGDLPLDPQREVLVFCDIGRRSQIAADLLTQRGFKARSLASGLVGWRAAGLPVQEAHD